MSPRSAANDQGEPATAPPALGVVPRLVTIGDVAVLLGLSVPTVERMHVSGKLPAPRRIGRANRWDRLAVEEWVGRPGRNGELLTRAEWQPIWASIVKSRTRPSVN